jgi:hypothetical protein
VVENAEGGDDAKSSQGPGNPSIGTAVIGRKISLCISVAIRITAANGMATISFT